MSSAAAEKKKKEDNKGSDKEEEDDDEDDEEVLPKGLVIWRDGLKQATTAAQVAMAFYMLETSIAWHKSIMKAYCQLCHCGDNEDSLLLCDGCDKGKHCYLSYFYLVGWWLLFQQPKHLCFFHPSK